MSGKSLLHVDAGIAKLRDQIAAGKATFESIAELDRLIEERLVLIQALSRESAARAAGSRMHKPQQDALSSADK